MTPMAYAWTLFSGASIIKRRLTWTNDDPFAGSEVYGDVYQVVGVPLFSDVTDNTWKEIADRFADLCTKAEARAEAAEAYIAVMETAIDEAIGADSVRPLLDSYEDRAHAVEAHIRTLKP